MKLLTASLLSMSIALALQPVAAVEAPTFDPQRLSEVVKTLSSDEFEGRGPATAGAWVEDAAARGVRYEINGEGKVQIVHVGGPAIQLVEGCS